MWQKSKPLLKVSQICAHISDLLTPESLQISDALIEYVYHSLYLQNVKKVYILHKYACLNLLLQLPL